MGPPWNIPRPGSRSLGPTTDVPTAARHPIFATASPPPETAAPLRPVLPGNQKPLGGDALERDPRPEPGGGRKGGSAPVPARPSAAGPGGGEGGGTVESGAPCARQQHRKQPPAGPVLRQLPAVPLKLGPEHDRRSVALRPQDHHCLGTR